jgi:hypothetical protein
LVKQQWEVVQVQEKPTAAQIFLADLVVAPTPVH